MESRRLADILTPDVVVFPPDTPLTAVLDAMEGRRISCVVAVDAGRRPLGILTERDILSMFATRGPLAEARLSDVMSAPAFTDTLATDYREAYIRLAERQVRHLVVVDASGALAGIVTEADFLHHLGEEYLVEVKTVATAMDRDVLCLEETQSLDAALTLMRERHSDYVVVLHAGGRVPAGILTERDVVRLARRAQDRAAPLGTLMTPTVHAIAPEAPLQEASLRMRQLAVRRLLVVSARQGVVGVITRHDIVKSLQGGYVEYLSETLSRLRREMSEPELPLLDFHRHLLLGGVIDLIDDGIYMVDTEGRILDANERGCALLGYSHAELRQLRIWGISAAIPDADTWATRQIDLIPHGATFDERHRRKDGSTFPVRVRVYVSRGAGQTVFIGVASDRSEEEALAATIRESERFYQHVIDSTVDGFFRIDARHRFIEANDRLCELLGYPREEVLGRTPLEFVTEESRAELIAQIGRIEATEHRRYQLVVRRKDGSTLPILLNNTTHRNLRGEAVGAFGFVTDLTPVLAAQQAVAESEQELRAILDNMQDTYYRTDLEGRLVRLSASAATLLGLPVGQVLGRRLADFYAEPAEREVFLAALQAGEGRLSGYETRLRHADGHEVWVLTNAHYVRDAAGHVIGVEGTSRDIGDRKRAEARIDFLAHHDPLTELPNRLLFKDRFERAMAHGTRAGLRAALLFVDLDRFKAVNDSFGHQAGDLLLREAARRLRACVRDTDTVSRQGGDEFLVALTDIRDDEAAATIAEKTLDALARPYDVDGHEATISASIGIALSPDDGSDFEALLRKADVAMYHAKDAGRNAFRFYNERMNVDSHERLELRQRIHHGLERGEFRLYYQPLVDLASGRVVGAEALLRWLCPERGLIAPAHFIPIAEESGLIVPLGEWVLHEACRELKAWHALGHAQLSMAVNLSAIQFRRGGLEDSLRAALQQSGVPASALELELTESILLHEADQALDVIGRLKGMGVRLAIDDFGTGYSSLSYLKRLAVDKLKIDQSFVRDMAHDPDDAAIVRAVIQMAKSLNLAVLAEGVETEQVAAGLRELACDLAQGYHFGHPVAAEEFRRLIGNAGA
jgi:diguanylate cyclase (GGDEF)-like protein/PAS domain S-box-containing protein